MEIEMQLKVIEVVQRLKVVGASDNTIEMALKAPRVKIPEGLQHTIKVLYGLEPPRIDYNSESTTQQQ